MMSRLVALLALVVSPFDTACPERPSAVPPSAWRPAVAIPEGVIDATGRASGRPCIIDTFLRADIVEQTVMV